MAIEPPPKPPSKISETQEMNLSMQARFEVMAQSATDAIISADGEGRIIFWNRAAERIFGYRPSELIGQHITQIMPPEYRNLHQNGMKRYQESGQPKVIGQTVELKGLRKNGEVFPLELSLSAWITAEEIFFNGIIRDISERKQAEETLRAYAAELEARNQELHAYDRTIAHDLKAPLGVIVTYTSLIRTIEPSADPQKYEKYLSRIENASHQMAHMIDQLLWLATVRDAEERFSPVDMGETIQRVMGRFHDRIEQEHITIEVIAPLYDVMGHSVWVEEIVANLIGNAIKYKGKENTAPRITFRTMLHPQGIHCEVQDNGLGIPPEIRHNLFEMFTRAHTQEASGFGLGLSIVHRMVTRLKGQVGVESELGKGSTFWFILPTVPTEA